MPTSYQWFISEFIPALSRTLVHSFWQGMLAALIAGLIILCTRKTSAATRYNALLLLFCSLLITVAVTFYLEMSSSAVSNTALSPAIAVDPNTSTESNSPFYADQPSFIAAVLAFVDKYSMALVSAWFLVFLFQLSRMGFGLRQIHNIRYKGIHPASSEWNEWMKKKAGELGIQPAVALLQSELAKVPVAIGYLKPIVLVPVGLLTQLSTEQAEAVLLHELAHIRRKDYLVNLLQSLVDAVFFFNPAFLWLSSLIRQEREKCCDDIVLLRTNNQNKYLEALVSFQEMNLSSTYAMAIGGKKYYLLNRVRRILTRENSRLTSKEVSSLAIGIIVIAFAFMAFKPISPKQTTQANPENKHVVSQTPLITPPTLFVQDTVPAKPQIKDQKPIQFKKIISNIVDDGENNTFQVQATAENGTVYKIRRNGNDIVGFSIDDKEIPKSEYKNYSGIMDAIEQARKKQLRHALNGQHQQHMELEHHIEALNEKLVDLDMEKQSLFGDSLIAFEPLFHHDESNVSLFNLDAENSLSSNPTIASIIKDLQLNKLIQSENNMSFSLTNTELIVNGKVQSKTMHEKFKSKYLKHPADRYKYSKEGNSTRTEINTN